MAEPHKEGKFGGGAQIDRAPVDIWRKTSLLRKEHTSWALCVGIKCDPTVGPLGRGTFSMLKPTLQIGGRKTSR